MIPVDTSKYEKQHGKKPSGKGYWKFQLTTPRVTERDHYIVNQEERSYDTALTYAQEVATRRRSDGIVVLP